MPFPQPELANAAFLTYSRSKGVFAGLDLTGDVVNQNQDDTNTYYGKDLSYETILTRRCPRQAILGSLRRNRQPTLPTPAGHTEHTRFRKQSPIKARPLWSGFFFLSASQRI